MNSYGITSSSKYEVNYGQTIPNFDVPDTTFILRYSYEVGNEIDEAIGERDTFNSLVRSSGYSSYIPQLSGSWTTDFVVNEDEELAVDNPPVLRFANKEVDKSAPPQKEVIWPREEDW